MHAIITSNAPIVSQQPYGTRFDYPVLTPSAASLALKGETQAFLKAALSYVQSHEDGDMPPRLAVRAPASLGKSTAIIEILKGEEFKDLRILYLVPTLELADELVGKARFAGINARTFRGRSAIMPGQSGVDAERMCAKHEVAASLSAAGYSIADTLCQSRIPTDKRDDKGKLIFEKVECPLAVTCAYFKQLNNREPGLIIGSHAYLTTPIDALKQEERIDLIIVDESFANDATVGGRRVILTDMMRPRDLPANAARYKQRDEFGRPTNTLEFDLADLAKGISIIEKSMELARKRRAQPIEEWQLNYGKLPSGNVTIDDILKVYIISKYDAEVVEGMFDHDGTLQTSLSLEFACVIPVLEPADALKVAETILSRIQNLRIPQAKTVVNAQHVTVSVGVASAISTTSLQPHVWIEHADKQLYLSKEAGGDQVNGTVFTERDGRQFPQIGI